jgi:hypothetical protein
VYKICTAEQTWSNHGPEITTKRTLDTLNLVENAQLMTGAPPGT